MTRFLNGFFESAKKGGLFWSIMLYATTLGLWIQFSLSIFVQIYAFSNHGNANIFYALLFAHLVAVVMLLLASQYLWFLKDARLLKKHPGVAARVLSLFFPFVTIPLHILRTRRLACALGDFFLFALIMLSALYLSLAIGWNHFVYPAFSNFLEVSVLPQINRNLKEAPGENL